MRLINRPAQKSRYLPHDFPALDLKRRQFYGSSESGEQRRLLVIRVIGLLLISVSTLLACVLGSAVLVLVVSVASALSIILLYPKYWWPAGSLSLLLLVPFSYSAGGQPASYLVPSNILVIIYTIFGAGKRHTWIGDGIALLIGAFACYCLLQIPFGGSDNNGRKLLWMALILFIVLVPSMFFSDARVFAPLVAILLSCCALISLFGVLEYMGKYNPLSEFFASSPDRLVQKWGDYRVLTFVGHPLVNASLLATLGAASMGAFLKRNNRVALLIFVSAGVAIIFTQSRTGVAALAIGVVTALLASANGRSKGRVIGSLILIIFAGLMFFQIDNPLLKRNASLEGQGSSELRFAYLEALPDLMDAASLWGTGAGLSDSALQKVGGYAASFPIESSAVQLLVSFGLVGSLLFAAVVVGTLALALRQGAFIFPSAFVAYAVSASGFNLFEAFPALIALPGVLLSGCMAEASVNRQEGVALKQSLALEG